MRPTRILARGLAVLAVLLCVPTGASATGIAPALEVTQSRGTNAVTEGDPAGYAASFALTAAPTGNVVVTFSGAGLVATPATLTFTPATARIPQPIVITAVDDTVASSGATRTLVATSSSVDHDFDQLTRSIDILVLDDDGVALHVDPTGSDTHVAERGAVDTVLVRLGTRPQQPVTVFLTGPSVIASPDMVVVRPDQWNTGVPSTIAALDDTLAQGIRTTTFTARTIAPDAIWNGLSVTHEVVVEDDDGGSNRPVRDGDPAVDPNIPTSTANRTPSAPAFVLPRLWTGSGSVGIKFTSTDADGDVLRYHVYQRSFEYGARAPGEWKLVSDSTKAFYSSGTIEPFEQRCFRVESADPFGAQAMSSVQCTHGVADDPFIASDYLWKATRMRGAWRGTVSQPGSRVRLLYFRHTGSEAILTFIKCRTCASIRMVAPDDTQQVISLRGTGRKSVTVPLKATGRRIWGFYVQGPGTVMLDSFAVLRPTT